MPQNSESRLPRRSRTPKHPTFSAHRGDFFSTVSARANAYLAEGGRRSHATLSWQIASLFLVAIVIALVYPAYVMGSMVAAIALGVVRAVAVLGPGHSVSHLALFKKTSTNKAVFRVIAPLLLTTNPVWNLTHVVHHHLYTLTDADLQDHYPFKRVQPSQRRRFWHRFQHVYIWPLYFLGLPVWQLLDLVRLLLSLFTGTFLDRKLTKGQQIEGLVGQAITVSIHVLLPFFFLPPMQAAAVMVISNAIAGLIVVLQIVVNHEVMSTALNTVDRGVDWGEHQMRTSHNYAMDSSIALHLSGGLNYQIEHHLFPRVHYVHYPALSGIVKAACAEFNLPYYASGSFTEAILSHYSLLQTLGAPESTQCAPVQVVNTPTGT